MERSDAKTFRFAEFELNTLKRQLRKQGQPVALNAKTFDLLAVLVERHGEVVRKEELMERVWPGQFVEEGNLTVQISTLRKILDEQKDEHRFIVTVPGRGYSFVADVDPPGNGDVVIERHSLSRIVIDEDDIPDDQTPAGLLPASDRAWHSRFTTRIGLAALGVLVIATAIYLLVQFKSASTPVAEVEKLQIKRLTTNGRVSFAALSPDGKMFVYALKELEQNSLWLGFVDGGDDKVLRPSEIGRYNDLAFSADGNYVFFTFSGEDSRESVLYRMPTLGGPKEEIRNKVTNFGVAPDGQRFAFGRYNGETKINQMIVARFDGGEDHALDLTGTRSFGSESVAWSPDGGTIAFAAAPEDPGSHDQLFLVSVADGAVRRVTDHGWKEIIKTSWLDDGKALLLVAQEKDSNTSVSYSQIWKVQLPDGEVKQLTRDLSSYRSVLNSAGTSFLTVELRQMNNIWVAPASDLSRSTQVTFGTFGKYDGLWGLDWTTDGKLVFTSTDHQSQVISQMNSDGSGVRQLTPPGYNDSNVNATADGRYIVFQSTRSGGSDIWRMNADGSDLVRLTSDGKSHQPFVSPDSKFIYFKSFVDGSGAMHRISIDGGAAEKLSEKEVSYLSVSPDGTRVAAGVGSRLVIIPTSGGAPEQEFDLTRFGTLSGNTGWTADGKAIMYRDRGYGYWVQDLDGGEPQRIKGLPKEKFYNFAWSKDGKQFAFVRGQEIRDVVLFRLSP